MTDDEKMAAEIEQARLDDLAWQESTRLSQAAEAQRIAAAQ